MHADDARPFLRKTDERYDFIFLDTYRQPYIPFYLATKEFFELARDRLAPGGAVIINVGHPEDSARLEQVLTATMGAAFPHVARDAVRDTQHAADRQHGRSVARRACWRRRRGCTPDLRPVALADARRLEGAARGRGRLHRRQGAGGVAGRQVAARLRRRRRVKGLPTAPLAPGDAGEVARVWRACEMHDDGEALFTEEDFVAACLRPSMDLERDTVAVRDGGAIVAVGLLLGERDAFVHVLPSHRGRGIGAWLLRWTEDAGRAAGRSWTCQTLSEHEHAAMALLEAVGYERRWEDWILDIELEREPDAAGAAARVRDPRLRPRPRRP